MRSINPYLILFVLAAVLSFFAGCVYGEFSYKNKLYQAYADLVAAQ